MATWTDNFDGYANGTTLVATGFYVGDTDLAVENTAANSGANGVWNTSATGRKYCFFSQKDNNGGNSTTSLTFQALSGASGSFDAMIFGRCSDTASPPTTGYAVFFGRSGSHVQLFYLSGGSFTAIADCAVTLTTGVWYTMNLVLSGTTVQVKLTALTGTNAGKWLDGTGGTGTWSVSSAVFVHNVTDSHVAAAVGYGGIGIGDEGTNQAEQGVADDFSFGPVLGIVTSTTEDFDTHSVTYSVAALNGQGPWAADTPLRVLASHSFSGANSVGQTVFSSNINAANLTNVLAADQQSSMKFQFLTGTNSGDIGRVYARGTLTPFETGTAFFAEIGYQNGTPNGTLKLYYKSAGVNTQLPDTSSTVSFTDVALNTWYTLVCWVKGSLVQAGIQRVSDGKWLQTAGTFVTSATPVYAISCTSVAIVDPGVVGFSMKNGTDDNVRGDDFIYQLATTTGTGGGSFFEAFGMATKYLGDVLVGDTVEVTFNTKKLTDGTPITLAGSPVAQVYKTGSLTQDTSAAISSIDVDYDSVTGLHHLTITTATTPAFYVAAKDYHVVLSAGTVDGTSVVGSEVATFSIENRTQKADVRKILGTAPTEGGAGRLAAAFTKLLDVATPRADVSASGIVILNDLAGDYMRRNTIGDLPTQIVGTDSRLLISTDAQDLSASFSVNTKKVNGTLQTAFDIGLAASKLSGMLQVDPNVGPAPAAVLYRFTHMALTQAKNEIQSNMNAVDLIGQATFAADATTLDALTTGPVNGAAYGIVQGVKYLFVSDSSRNRILAFDATPGVVNKTAKFVFGQADFVTSTANTPGFGTTTTGSKCLSNPQGLVFDTAGYLWAADKGNHRVLRYNFTSAIATNQGADVVLGQTSMTGHSANQGGAASATTMNNPIAVAWDASGTRLFVADQSNNRVTSYGTFTNGASGVAFLGQSTNATTSTGLTQNRLSSPGGLAWDNINGYLYVGDGGNNRIMVWGSSIATNSNADFVLGQANFTTSGTANGISQTNIQSVGTTMAFHTERSWLIAPDAANERVMIWDTSEGLSNFMPAAYVLGQSSFSQSIGNAPASEQNRSDGMNAVALDQASDRIFVGETLTNAGRVAVYQINSYLRRNLASDFPRMTEPTAMTSVNDNMVAGMSMVHMMCVNERNETASAKQLKNQAGSVISTATITTDGTTFVNHGKFV